MNTIMTGKEVFANHGKPIGFTMQDFWQFQYSNIYDLQESIAEFLVAKALCVEKPYNRSGWTLWDINYKGLKIEVKETGYYYYSWQSENDTHNHLRVWDIHKTYVLDKDGNRIPYGTDFLRKRQNDVYVFCLNDGHSEDDSYPLELKNWKFFVVSTKVIDEKCGNQKTISLRKVQQLVDNVSFDEIKPAIDTLLQKQLFGIFQ